MLLLGLVEAWEEGTLWVAEEVEKEQQEEEQQEEAEEEEVALALTMTTHEAQLMLVVGLVEG
jgi:hypothetical protein